MSYFNDYASFYPISSARDEFDAYQFPDQTSATEGDNYGAPYSSFTDPWGMLEQPGSMVGSSTSLPATDSHGTHCCNLSADWCLTLESPELLAPTTSYTNQTGSYGQPSYSGDYWPEIGQQAQPYHSGSLSQDYSFDSTVVPEPSIVDPTPDSCKGLSSLKLRVLETYRLPTVPFNNWGGNQSGPSTGTFHMVSTGARLSSCNQVDAFRQENAYTHHQLGTAGPARTGPMSTGRFQPYERSRARRSERVNAEAGPSTLIPPPVPCAGLPTLQPSGGMISETTADAEKTQAITEEEEVSVSNFYCSHILRVIEWSFGVRRSPSGPSAPTARTCGGIPSDCTTGYRVDRGPRKS